MNKDYLLRIIKTFVQAVISALVVQLAAGVDFTNKEAVKSLIIGLVAAGISAVMNINKARKPVESIYDDDAEDVETEDENA